MMDPTTTASDKNSNNNTNEEEGETMMDCDNEAAQKRQLEELNAMSVNSMSMMIPPTPSNTLNNASSAANAMLLQSVADALSQDKTKPGKQVDAKKQPPAQLNSLFDQPLKEIKESTTGGVDENDKTSQKK
ncbi:unnamed protein product [Cylindrotheca closterium]|uniref:Uncharacterized protein n=1 Tax=Cylindrotheca closterium TaxID=2856 RepID=A0AAD2CQI7_9STRA|nr:unnamed protein product [Cylindrotheca closterium]